MSGHCLRNEVSVQIKLLMSSLMYTFNLMMNNSLINLIESQTCTTALSELNYSRAIAKLSLNISPLVSNEKCVNFS